MFESVNLSEFMTPALVIIGFLMLKIERKRDRVAHYRTINQHTTDIEVLKTEVNNLVEALKTTNGLLMNVFDKK